MFKVSCRIVRNWNQQKCWKRKKWFRRQISKQAIIYATEYLHYVAIFNEAVMFTFTGDHQYILLSQKKVFNKYLHYNTHLTRGVRGERFW
jgi:hypothetical protein